MGNTYTRAELISVVNAIVSGLASQAWGPVGARSDVIKAIGTDSDAIIESAEKVLNAVYNAVYKVMSESN